nr:MAG TPA: hypothetical protein [Bacteriophage sp.]
MGQCLHKVHLRVQNKVLQRNRVLVQNKIQ